MLECVALLGFLPAAVEHRTAHARTTTAKLADTPATGQLTVRPCSARWASSRQQSCSRLAGVRATGDAAGVRAMCEQAGATGCVLGTTPHSRRHCTSVAGSYWLPRAPNETHAPIKQSAVPTNSSACSCGGSPLNSCCVSLSVSRTVQSAVGGQQGETAGCGCCHGGVQRLAAAAAHIARPPTRSAAAGQSPPTWPGCLCSSCW